MEDHRVSRRYAQALFQTAEKYDIVQSVEEDLASFDHLLERDKEFRYFFISPLASRTEKTEIIERIFSDRITALTMQLIRVMLEKGRETELQSVRTHFVRLRRERAGIVHAVVTSATALDEKQKADIIASVTKVVGKTLEADFEVQPHLIGGVKVTYGNNVLDGTVRGALSRLRDQLRHDVLKQA